MAQTMMALRKTQRKRGAEIQEIPIPEISENETLIEPVHGKSVVILGDGPIGLFAVGVARASGATKIFLTGMEPYRLDIGKKMGADRVIDVTKENAVEIIKDATDGIGADVVIE